MKGEEKYVAKNTLVVHISQLVSLFCVQTKES